MDKKVDIGLSEKQRATVSKMLESVLADEVAAYFAARGAHWNVTGMNFGALHLFFEKQYELLDEAMDSIAERIRQLGAKAPSTLTAFQGAKRLDESVGQSKDAVELLKGLLAVHEHVIRSLRKDVDICDEQHDQGTADFLTGLMEEHEKMAWMVRAHLE